MAAGTGGALTFSCHLDGEARMKPMQIERVVAAPAARVWGIMTDLDRSPDVLSAVTRVERLDGGSTFGVGTRWKETREVFGKEATEEMAVTAVEPGRSYVVEADSRGAHYRSTMGVEPLDDARSRLYLSFGAEPEGLGGQILAATVGRLFRGVTRRMLRRDLDDIAAAAEGPAAAV